MPRPRRFEATDLLAEALPVFWRDGYGASSMDALTRATGASRQAIYGAFPDKRALLLACLDAYREQVVTPAIAPAEAEGAGLAEIAGYFETQIAAAERGGLPGPGCLLVNLASEAAPHDAEVAAAVEAHLLRLRTAFLHALQAAAPSRSAAEREGWAALLVVAAQGLWSVARTARDAAALRTPVRALLSLIERAAHA